MSFLTSHQPKIREGLQFTQEEFEALPKEHQESVTKALANPGHGFDLRTHIVEPKSGILLSYQPYRRLCEHGQVIYFRKDKYGKERRYTEQGHCLDQVEAPKEAKAK